MGIPDSTNETMECKLIEKVTCVNVNQECLELCHPLTSDKKKIIVTFSGRKDVEIILQKKSKIRTLTLKV